MKKRFLSLTLSALMIMGVTGCSKNDVKEKVTNAANATKTQSEQASSNQQSVERKISYKGKDYTISGKNPKIVITGSLESMEDALLLGVKPIGAMTVGNKFPAMFKDITQESKPIGEKAQPNVETILSLKPDIILGTSKFPAETLEKLSKVANTIPVSHIATDWEANLLLMGQLSDKEAQAKQIIQKYKEDVQSGKEKIAAKLKDKKVIAVRIRAGNISIYPQDVFFNPVLYSELGLPVPEPVKASKAQEVISLEKLSELNPDYIFLQFSEEENADKPKALEELQRNPIWKSINAVKNGKVFVNTVDPLAQGGTAWSKSNFLKVAVSKLSE